MYPPIFSVCSAVTAVTDLLGAAPCRLYLFGAAPQGVAKPYAVWQLIGGAPDNCLGDLPDLDGFSVQVDVYATSASGARSVAQALRDAIEPHAYITAWLPDRKDPDTGNYTIGFSVDWLLNR